MEILAYHKVQAVEKVYLKFLNQILNVKSQTLNVAVYGEFGLFPLQDVRNIKILKYWLKVLKNSNFLMCKLI